MNSKGEIRRSIVDLNPLIVCTLCKGYFIDPVTLVECLHSFCKTCIMKHVEKSEVCPICDIVIHKTKPFSSMREDKTLQDIVFKIVPGLHHNEMLRRKKFYATHPSKGKVPDVLERELRHKIFFNQEDKFSISIQYFDPSSMSIKGGSSDKENSLNGGGGGNPCNPNKRYLECPGPMQVCHLKKFIAMKYGLNLESFIIDIIYKDDLIPNNYTLIDIAYNYNWKKDHPMQFFYRIFKKSKVLLKRKRKTSRVEEKCSEPPQLTAEEPSSPKKWKGDHLSGGDKSPRSSSSSNGSGPQKPTNVPPKESSEKKRSPINTTSSKTSSTSSSVSSHKVVKNLMGKSSKSGGSKDKSHGSSSSNNNKSQDPLPKIIVTSKHVKSPERSHKAPPVLSSSSSNGGASRPATIQTSIISKEDKNGKTLIIRKSPMNPPPSGGGVKQTPPSSGGTVPSRSTPSPKISSVSSEKTPKSSASLKGPQSSNGGSASVKTSSCASVRPLLPKSDKNKVTDEVKKKYHIKSGSSNNSAVSAPMDTSEINGKSEVTKGATTVIASSGSSSNTTTSAPSVSSSSNYHHNKSSTPNNNSQNNLSKIVKSLTAKKQLEDSQASSSGKVISASSSPKHHDVSPPSGDKKGGEQPPSKKPSLDIKSSDKSSEKNKELSKITPVSTTASSLPAFEKKAPTNNNNNNNSASSAEALAQSIFANYAIAAAAQHVSAAQVLTNQLSLTRGAYQGGLEHLLRPPYVKVASPDSAPSPSSPNSNSGGSQIPNTNRLQFKVQASPSNSNLTSIFSSSGSNGGSSGKGSSLPPDIKSLFGASVKKFNSNVPKALNQSIRQIPNPSLLTNKGNNSSVQKKS